MLFGAVRVVTTHGRPTSPRGCAVRARVAAHRLAVTVVALPQLGCSSRTARPPVRSAPDRPCHRCCRWCHCRHRRITTLALAAALRRWPALTLRARGRVAVALPLMALRRVGHAGREHECLSASAWPRAAPVAPTASHQGTPLPSRWLPLPHRSLALSLFVLVSLPPSNHTGAATVRGHLSSIPLVHASALTSPPGFDCSLAEPQFWSFAPLPRC